MTAGHERFLCDHDEFVSDTALNQVLRAACVLLAGARSVERQRRARGWLVLRLAPDLLLERPDGSLLVIDTKWKR